MASHIRKDTALVNAGESYNTHSITNKLNLSHVGTNGLDRSHSTLANNTPYTKQNSIALLTRAPGAWDNHPKQRELTDALVNLIEVWPQSWDGLDITQTVDVEDTLAGRDGQGIPTVSRVSRAAIEATINGPDLYNQSISSFVRYIVNTLYKDPNTQRPNLSELNVIPDDWLSDKWSFDYMIIEQDPTGARVHKAIAVANNIFTTLPEDSFLINTQEGTPIQEISIGMKGIYTGDTGIYRVAQDYVDRLALYSINPNLKPAFFQEIDADVAASNTGILGQATNIKDTYGR